MKIARFLIFIILFFSTSYSLLASMNFDPDKYRYFIASTEEDGFTLSNQTRWIADQNGTTRENPFQVGAEIFMLQSAFGTSRGHFLIADSKSGLINYSLDPFTEKFLPTFIAMRRICIQEPGWFTSGKYLHIMELSDGSQWDCLGTPPLPSSYWKPGDRLIITALQNSEFKYWFIWNLEITGSFFNFQACEPYTTY